MDPDSQEAHNDEFLPAANAMRPALMELASSKKDRKYRKLRAGEIASLPDGRKELEAFADWLRKDRQVRKRVADTWNSVVQQGQDRSLPSAFSVQSVNDPDNETCIEDSCIYGTYCNYEIEHY